MKKGLTEMPATEMPAIEMPATEKQAIKEQAAEEQLIEKQSTKKRLTGNSRILITALLAMCLAFALAGCGGSGDGADAASPEEALQDFQGGAEGTEITFETTDLDGEPVTSESIFSSNKVTMVNIWGTYCGPCIEEMPELEKLNQEFNEKDGAIVGLVCDVPEGDDSNLADAHSIVGDTGVTYTNLRAWAGFDDVMSLVAIPTTYFVDSQGRLLGEPIVGADLQGYRERMEEYLNQ